MSHSTTLHPGPHKRPKRASVPVQIFSVRQKKAVTTGLIFFDLQVQPVPTGDDKDAQTCYYRSRSKVPVSWCLCDDLSGRASFQTVIDQQKNAELTIKPNIKEEEEEEEQLFRKLL